MKIALFGGTGPTGSHVLEQLLSAGYRVKALARDPEKLNSNELLEVVSGNVLDFEKVQYTVEGCDAAISCLGIGGMGDGTKTTLVSEGTANIVKALGHDRKFTCISNTGVGTSIKAFPWKMRNIDIRFKKNWKWFRAVLADKQRMEHIVRHSGVNYVIVRSPQIIMNDKRSSVEISDDGRGIGGQIYVRDLAAFLIEHAVSQNFSKRMICVASKTQK